MKTLQRNAIRVGVFGGGTCPPDVYQLAVTAGAAIAQRGGVVVCGGLGGVMEAVCKGAVEAGGVTIGILPGDSPDTANPYVTVPIATGMGIARNSIIVRTADVCLAIDGKYGTLSEIAYALQLEKKVVTLQSWDAIPGVIPATSVEEAMQLLFETGEER